MKVLSAGEKSLGDGFINAYLDDTNRKIWAASWIATFCLITHSSNCNQLRCQSSMINLQCKKGDISTKSTDYKERNSNNCRNSQNLQKFVYQLLVAIIAPFLEAILQRWGIFMPLTTVTVLWFHKNPHTPHSVRREPYILFQTIVLFLNNSKRKKKELIFFDLILKYKKFWSGTLAWKLSKGWFYCVSNMDLFDRK